VVQELGAPQNQSRFDGLFGAILPISAYNNGTVDTMRTQVPLLDCEVMDYQQLKADNKKLNFQEIRQGKSRIESKPLFFWFDIYGPCNLECKHCEFQIHGRTSEKEISDDLYQSIIQTLMPTAYRCNLGGTNLGEMTIAPKFQRFLNDCQKYEVKVNLTTNGTRMDDDWFDDLVDVLDVIGFSMEGIEEQFEEMRGFKWRFFLKHVEKVIEARADQGKHYQVEWRYCAHSDNIHQLPDMVRLANKIGLDRIQVMNLVPYVPAQKFKNLNYHRSLANRYFTEARELASELGVIVNVPPDYQTGSFNDFNLVQLGAKHPNSDLEMVNCYHPWQTCSINELGIVKPCCVYWRSMGNLNKSSFQSIWNGKKYQKLRSSVNGKPDGICHDCRMPKFDSDHNTSASQLVPGIRDLVRAAVTVKPKETISFTGVMEKEFDPV
jgi:MoaA/NifB/PqqE/SkfB family radical SAM enzyme